MACYCCLVAVGRNTLSMPYVRAGLTALAMLHQTRLLIEALGCAFRVLLVAHSHGGCSFSPPEVLLGSHSHDSALQSSTLGRLLSPTQPP